MEGPPYCSVCLEQVSGLCASINTETAIWHLQANLAQNIANNICLAVLFHGGYNFHEAILFKYYQAPYIEYGRMGWVLILG
jgi:hypothetical protein